MRTPLDARTGSRPRRTSSSLLLELPDGLAHGDLETPRPRAALVKLRRRATVRNWPNGTREDLTQGIGADAAGETHFTKSSIATSSRYRPGATLIRRRQRPISVKPILRYSA
jgi:hypothetical protein